jgi:beta-galactosidase
VLDGETSVADMDLEAYLRAGGRVLVLAGSQTHAPLGARRQLVKAFDGSLKAPDWPEAAGLSSSDLRYRAACDSWLMAEGCDLGAEGLLGLRRVGAGVILYCQLDPARFNADERTYFRFTRWRQTRALTQVLANLGATFAADRLVFNPKDASLTRSLAGAWKARLTGTLQELSVGLVAPARDPGISALAARLVASDAPDADWAELPVPGEWQAAGGKWNVNGEVVYRLTLDLPESWAGQDLRLSLGTLDDFDTTFFNGVQVGGSPDRINSQYDVPRLYTIPGRIVHAGKNHLAVRIWDDKGAGGFTDSPDNLSLRVAAEPERAAAWYHPDYRDDFSRGDDPWRYYRW